LTNFDKTAEKAKFFVQHILYKILVIFTEFEQRKKQKKYLIQQIEKQLTCISNNIIVLI